jgi:hypothetical protein
MLRRCLVMAGLAVGLVAGSSSAGTSVGVGVILAGAPPPPVVVVREEPKLLLVSGVHVVDDRRIEYDTFRYGGVWFVFHRGYWYRAGSHRGPYVAIHTKHVPAAIIRVPARHWKKGLPPGHAKKREPDVLIVSDGGMRPGKKKGR